LGHLIYLMDGRSRLTPRAKKKGGGRSLGGGGNYAGVLRAKGQPEGRLEDKKTEERLTV